MAKRSKLQVNAVVILLLAVLLTGAKWYSESREGFFQSFTAGLDGYVVIVLVKDILFSTSGPNITSMLKEIRQMTDGTVLWKDTDTATPSSVITNGNQYVFLFKPETKAQLISQEEKLLEINMILGGGGGQIDSAMQVVAAVKKDSNSEKLYTTDYKELVYGTLYVPKYKPAGVKIVITDTVNTDLPPESEIKSIRDKNFKLIWSQGSAKPTFVKDELYYIFMNFPSNGPEYKFSTQGQLLAFKGMLASRPGNGVSLVDILVVDSSGTVYDSNLNKMTETTPAAPATATTTETKKDEGLGTGAIVGISIGAVLVVLVVAKFLFSSG